MEGASCEVDGGDDLGEDVGAEVEGLGAAVVHELEAEDALKKAGEFSKSTVMVS